MMLNDIFGKQDNSKRQSNITAFLIIGLLFFIFGFVTWLNGILIPFLKRACDLTDFQSYLVATAFFAAYFVMSLPSSLILNLLGTKKGMSVGLVVMAVGSLIFLPAASSRDFDLFLLGLFVQGTGLALLQTAANPYVSVLGPIESAAQRISIMGISNKLAGIIGNLIFGSILLKGTDEIGKQIDSENYAGIKANLLDSLAGRIHLPYTIMAIVLLVVAIIIAKSSLSDIKEQAEETGSIDKDNRTSILQYPQVFLGFLAIFFYVAAEVMAGDLISSYGKNLGFSTEDTKYFTSFGLIGLLLGYVVSIVLIPERIKQEKWLSICAILSLILAIASYFVSDKAAVFCLASLGFTNAVMWPAIFPLGIKNLGRFTNIGSAILVMGIVGGAVIPPLYGFLYEKANIGLDFRSAFALLMTICYAYIFWFGNRKEA